MTVRLCSVPPPILMDRTPAGQVREEERTYRVPQCRIDTIHLQTSVPSPGLEHWPFDTA
ncbi:hypothetical protein X975_01330, partial [Stegodyphus mimosarum]